MASSIVGTLKVLLTADTATYETGLDKASRKTQQFSGEMSGFAANVSTVGKSLSGLLTLGAIAGAVTAVSNYASKIADLAAQTGLTTKTIQEMQHAANLTGASLENFTNAAFKLGTNLAGGSDSVVNSLRRLGLEYNAIRQMSPDQQFNVITTALGGVQDAQERNRLAVELFGKAAKDILPAIAQGYDQLAASATTAGDQQIQALDMAGDALDSFLGGVKNLSVELAGGFIIALRELNNEIIQNLSMVKELKRSYQEWSNVLDAVGVTSVKLPKVLEAAAVHARALPEPLRNASMSLQEQAKAEAELTKQVEAKIKANKEAIKTQQDMQRNQERFAASVQRLDTAEFFVKFKASVEEASQELEELPASADIAINGLARLKDPVHEADMTFESFADRMRSTFVELPNVILQAIQGGGSVIGSAGAFIGTNLMSKFQEKFGPLIKSALPFGIGEAVNALLPTLGALFGPVAEKIAGFFKRIFGGPSAEELRGRQAVADFEDQLHSLLSQTQKNEAGNESWKMTVIAIRDAYLAAGKTEAEALAITEKLWASSKVGGGETQRIIAQITAVLAQSGGAAAQLAEELDNAFRDRSFTVTENRQINEVVNRTYSDGEAIDGGEGFATGTLGRMGKWFGSFPQSGFQTALHGIEAVITPQQAPAFAMDVLGASGMSSQGGVDMSGLEQRLWSVEQLLRDQPRSMARAVQEVVNRSGGGRR